MSDTRKIERAYTEAGIMPLKDYVAKYEDSAVRPAPSYAMTVNALPLPEGFKQIMRRMGIEATGLIIAGPMSFTVFDKHGSSYQFSITNTQIQE